jgi:hypothetical protein
MRSRKYKESEAFVFVKKTVFMKERAEEKPEDLWSQFLLPHWLFVECK